MTFHLSCSSLEVNWPSGHFAAVVNGSVTLTLPLPRVCPNLARSSSGGTVTRKKRHGGESQSEARHHFNIQANGATCAGALGLV